MASRNISAIVFEILLKINRKLVPWCGLCSAEVANGLGKVSFISWGSSYVAQRHLRFSRLIIVSFGIRELWDTRRRGGALLMPGCLRSYCREHLQTSPLWRRNQLQAEDIPELRHREDLVSADQQEEMLVSSASNSSQSQHVGAHFTCLTTTSLT